MAAAGPRHGCAMEVRGWRVVQESRRVSSDTTASHGPLPPCAPTHSMRTCMCCTGTALEAAVGVQRVQDREFVNMTTVSINVAPIAIPALAGYATDTRDVIQRRHTHGTHDGSSGRGCKHVGAAVRAAQCR